MSEPDKAIIFECVEGETSSSDSRAAQDCLWRLEEHTSYLRHHQPCTLSTAGDSHRATDTTLASGRAMSCNSLSWERPRRKLSAW